MVCSPLDLMLVGLLGSTYYVNDLKDKGRLQDIAVNFNIDMMGPFNFPLLLLLIACSLPELLPRHLRRLDGP